MPKILDLELKALSLALRVITGIIAAGITFLLLYYLPANFLNILGQFIPAKALPDPSILNPLLSSLVNPSLPMIGLLLTVLVFLECLLRGSKAYGPILILTGLSFIAYLYLLFQGGTLSMTVPPTFLMGISAGVALDLTTIMLLFMLPAILTIIKGAVLMTKKSGP